MRRRMICLLLAALLMLSVGCGVRPESPKEDGRLKVVCTLFPYYDFVRAIGGEHVEPQLLVPAGRETHSFEPTPLDVIKVADADMLIYNGGHGEFWVSEILQSAGEEIPTVVRMMDHTQALEEEIVEGMEGHHHHHDHEEESDHDHDEEPAHDHDHSEHDHHHDEDDHHAEIEYDEHIWTSPVGSKELCRAIYEALCSADPAHQTDYEANLTAYLQELDALDEAFRQVVSEGRRDLLIFGDRFPMLYFCKTYDLDYRAAFHGCAGDTEPSLETLKYLIDKVNDEQIPVVYTIELSSRKIANAIAETTGANVEVLHSCQTVSRQEFDRGETYISLMWRNVDALKEGLS